MEEISSWRYTCSYITDNIFYLHLPSTRNLLFNQQMTWLPSWYIEIRDSFGIILQSCLSKVFKNLSGLGIMKKIYCIFISTLNYIYICIIYIDAGLHEYFVLVFLDSKNACHHLQPWFLGDHNTCIEACNKRKDILAATSAGSNTFISFCTLIYLHYTQLY